MQNLSNFKLGVYDFLGLVVPGMFMICEGGLQFEVGRGSLKC